MKNQTILILIVAVFVIYYVAIIAYDLLKKDKKYIDYSVGNYEEEKPILVTEEYIYSRSGRTKEEVEKLTAERMEKMRKEFSNSGKRPPKKERSVDDDLGMSF